jgi:hypothetical protein
MKYLMFVCVDPELLTPESTKDMGPDSMAWVEEMDGRGVRLQGNRLQEISTATTVRVRGGEVVLADGPFAETKELIAGFWLFQVKSLDEAIEWVKRAPNPFLTGESEIEIRQVFEADDFGPELTPEVKEYEERLGKQMAANAKR